MPAAPMLVAVMAATGLVSYLGTRALIPLLRRRAVLDRPNERSLHAIPVPRGGGIAVVGTTLLAWLVLVSVGGAAASILAVMVGAVGLAAVSWRDDLAGLPPALRLASQALAVAIALTMPGLIGARGLSQGLLPLWLDRAVAGLLWLWFINLFNFMDGIDGMAGSEAAAIAIGLTLFAGIGAGHDLDLALLAVTIAGAAVGFLILNWAPARIFLGDVGSVPLGFLLGFLLLGVAADGHWRIALILPLYFLADATITLLRRLFRGDRVWEPHRLHFYQRAVQNGLGHAAVMRRVNAANLLLIGFGWAAENGGGWIALGAAVITVILLLGLIGLRGGRGSIPVPQPHFEEPPA